MEKSKMRETLEMFEEAGFTVTGLSHRKFELLPDTPEYSDYFQVSVKVRHYNEGTATAGNIISLIERNNYRLTRFEITAGIASFTMIPAGISLREEFHPGKNPHHPGKDPQS
jgi:hypothetical protein